MRQMRLRGRHRATRMQTPWSTVTNKKRRQWPGWAIAISLAVFAASVGIFIYMRNL
jgi:hypothetical protein